MSAIGRLFSDPEALRDVLLGVVRQGRLWATNTPTLADDLLLKVIDDAVSDPENWAMFLAIIGDGKVAMDEVRASGVVAPATFPFGAQLVALPEFMGRVETIAKRLGLDPEQVREELVGLLHGAVAA
jgi:hypothetical protein